MVVLLASSNWTSKISYEAVASLLPLQSVCAVLRSFIPISARSNGSLEAVHARIDDD